MKEKIKDFFEKLKTPKESIMDSREVYIYPFSHPNPATVPTEDDKRTHKGPFQGAIDFILESETEVLAAASGVVIEVVDGSNEYGNHRKFTEKANYITIYHPDTNEYSQYIHLKNGSTLVEVNQKIRQGQPIAKTGLSGFMDKPHLHFFVFKDTSTGFIGLRPRFQDLFEKK